MVRAILGSRHTFPGCLYLRDHRTGHLSWAVVLLMVGVVVLCGVWCVVWCGVMHSSFIYWQGRTTVPTGCSNASLMTGCCHNFYRVSRKIISKIVWVNDIISLSAFIIKIRSNQKIHREDSFVSSKWKLKSLFYWESWWREIYDKEAKASPDC